jgi:hypothetical protein
VAAALRELGQDPFGTKVYATPDQTRARLERSGFEDVECWLHEEPVAFDSRRDLETYLATIVLGDHVAGRPPDRAGPFVRRVVDRMPGLEIDYVRLNIRASRR